jgi:hypothetical protein
LEYPKNFDEMMGRTFAFRVKWQKDWKACSVLECKDSKVLVSRIQKEVVYSVKHVNIISRMYNYSCVMADV